MERGFNINPHNQLTMTECNPQVQEIIEDPNMSTFDKKEKKTHILQRKKNNVIKSKQKDFLHQHAFR